MFFFCFLSSLFAHIVALPSLPKLLNNSHRSEHSDVVIRRKHRQVFLYTWTTTCVIVIKTTRCTSTRSSCTSVPPSVLGWASLTSTLGMRLSQRASGFSRLRHKIA
ncbi:hypothetical protein F5884DRAFT_449997 [Xylogone sp. PMI_703]|nr:hypothetical protein F5884DRAFT_449997 [Xylogone sp. PMI_703]